MQPVDSPEWPLFEKSLELPTRIGSITVSRGKSSGNYRIIWGTHWCTVRLSKSEAALLADAKGPEGFTIRRFSLPEHLEEFAGIDKDPEYAHFIEESRVSYAVLLAFTYFVEELGIGTVRQQLESHKWGVRTLTLRDEVRIFLGATFESVVDSEPRSKVVEINGINTLLEVATEDSGEHYRYYVSKTWLDDESVEFYLFACRSPKCIFVFPKITLREFVSSFEPSPSRDKIAFTIRSDVDELVPHGSESVKFDVKPFRNAFKLISSRIQD